MKRKLMTFQVAVMSRCKLLIHYGQVRGALDLNFHYLVLFTVFGNILGTTACCILLRCQHDLSP